jgi:hypothetical protein
VDLGGGAAAGRGGGSDILSKRARSVVCRLVMSRLICSRPAESSSTLWRTAARPDDVASNCSLRAGGRATGVAVLCGTEAAGLEDCQVKAAATPPQNVIKNAIISEMRLSTDNNLIRSPLFSGPIAAFESSGTSVASSDGLVCQWRAENHDLLALSTEFICCLPFLADLTAIRPASCDQSKARGDRLRGISWHAPRGRHGLKLKIVARGRWSRQQGRITRPLVCGWRGG